MTRLSNEELNDLLDMMDVEDFLSFEGLDYRVTRGRSGTQLNLRECPRCHGRDWKVYLNAETGLGTCFHGSCVGEPGFNKFSFVYHLNDKSYRDTINVLKRYGQSVGWRPKVRKEKPQDEPECDLVLPESFALPINGKTLKYLTDRGFGPSVAEYFEWRFCKSGFYSYTHGGERKKQDYSNRVIIPVRNIEGTLVTFQGRSIESNPLRKYIFPPGLPGAGRFIYNANNAVGKTRAIMGEGVFDVAAIKIALDQAGYSDIAAIGSFGKSLSMASSGDDRDQLSELKALHSAGLREITMMWDGEPSTIAAAVDTALELTRYGFDTRVAVLPDGKDPNEVSATSVIAAFDKAIIMNRVNAIRLKSKYRFA